MSKTPTDPGDWNSASALFRDARSDHAPSTADRERVRSALAQKLANPPAAADQPLTAAGANGATLSKLAKLGIGVGVAIIAAGAFTLLRAREPARPAEPKPMAAQSSPSVPAGAQYAASPAPEVPAGPGRAEAAARIAPPRSRPSASADAERRARERTVAGRPRGPARAPAATAAEARESGMTATPSPSTVTAPSESKTAASNASTAAAQSPSPAADAPSRQPTPPRPAAAAAPEPARERAAAQASNEPDPGLFDARAELAFVQRIQSALRGSDTAEVLALCAEHQRRWPKGTFVQEREALRAIASCNSNASNAGARARVFLASYARGPLAPRVREACAAQLTNASAFGETARQR